MIYILGGSNMDIYGIPASQLRQHDSNIGTVRTAHGGVARNITESLARLHIPVTFMSAFGNDAFGRELIKTLENLHVNLTYSCVFDEKSTATYLAVMDNMGDMDVAICDNTIINSLSEEAILHFLESIKENDILFMDTNLSEEIIAFVMRHTKAHICIDPLSVAKTEKIKRHLKNIYICKPNIYEAEAMVGFAIQSQEDLQRAGKLLNDEGIQHLYISLGDKGMYYRSQEAEYYIETERQPMINASGAGDACMAGLIYGEYLGLKQKDIIELAMTNAVLALESETTVNQQLNEELLKNKRTTLTFEWRNL